MKQLVLNINDNKLSFFLELIKNFDFISVENADWYTTLSDDQKISIEVGLDDIKNGRTKSHAEVIASAKAKIQSLKDK